MPDDDNNRLDNNNDNHKRHDDNGPKQHHHHDIDGAIIDHINNTDPEHFDNQHRAHGPACYDDHVPTTITSTTDHPVASPSGWSTGWRWLDSD